MAKKKPHIEVNQIDEKKKSSMANRIIVAAIMLAIFVPAIVLGGWFYFAAIMVFLIGAIYEVIHTSRKKYPWYVYAFTYGVVLSYVYWVFIKDNVSSYILAKELGRLDSWSISLEYHFDTLYVSVFAIGIALGGYFFFSIFNKDFDIGDVGYFFTMTMLVGLGFQALLFVRYYPFAYGADSTPAFPWVDVDKDSAVFKYWHSWVFFAFVLITLLLNDAFAYFVGVFFGKHHMNERISPNKTWEGFFGGCILGGLSGLVFLMITDACGFPMLPTMKIFGENSQWWWPVIFSMGLPLIGNLGDLSLSFIKRSFNIKDYSHFLGAHGGILDRADSLMFGCLFAAVFAVSVTLGWNFFA